MTIGRTTLCSSAMALLVRPRFRLRAISVSLAHVRELGNRIERCLSYDEKPLLLFQKLKDAKKNPVFMLKHIKDIRSPIAVAQQKQAARKASATEAGSAKSTPAPSASTHVSPGQDRGRPPQLKVNSHLPNQTPGLLTGVPNGQSGWPELMSPLVENKGDAGADSSKTQGDAGTSGAGDTTDGGAPPVLREMPPATEVSFAVAIYPYMAEQEDEFDVVVYVLASPSVLDANSMLTSLVLSAAILSSSSHERVDGGLYNATLQALDRSTKTPVNKVGCLPDVCLKPRFLSRLPSKRRLHVVAIRAAHHHRHRREQHRSCL